MLEAVMRVGLGIDLHRFVEGRDLVLGGVRIPHHQGLEGHSDADALTHAICDALLGAAGMGDIGQHFPDTVEAFRDISSLVLLTRVKAMIDEADWKIENVDAVLIADAPKLSRYLDEMTDTLAATLEIDPSRLNLKATRTEGLGTIGRGEGIYVHAIAGLARKNGASLD